MFIVVRVSNVFIYFLLKIVKNLKIDNVIILSLEVRLLILFIRLIVFVIKIISNRVIGIFINEEILCILSRL